MPQSLHGLGHFSLNIFSSLETFLAGKMELLVKKHLNPMFLFLLVVTVPTIIGAEFAIKNEEYQQTKNVELNFTKVVLGNKLSRIQCSRMCSEHSSCLGVGIQEKTAGEVRCSR